MTRSPESARMEDLLAHADWLRRLAARLVSDQDADDLVQETWTAAMAARPAADRPAEPWLATVVRNLARTRWRRGRVRQHAGEALAAEQAAVVAPSPAELLERAQLQRALVELVVELEEPYRTAILLRYYEGKTPAEIAAREGVPGGTVRWRLSEGIERLKRRLDRRHGDQRRAWVALLVPAPEPTAPTAAPPELVTAPGGALAVALASKGKLALGVAALVAIAAVVAGVGLSRRGDGATAPHAHLDPPGSGAGTGAAPARPLRFAAGPAPVAGGGSIAGIVLGPDGRGVPGAAVTVLEQRWTDPQSPGPRTVRAGAAGDFRVTELAPGAYTVAASAAGLAGAAPGRLKVAAGARIEGVKVTLGAEVVVVSGRLLDEGGGTIPSGRVRALSFMRAGTAIPEAHLFEAGADGEGRYRLELPRNRYALTAEAEGYASAQEVVEMNRAVARDFRLQPAARLSGRVVTVDGNAPVAGAEVWVESRERHPDAPRQPVTTDAAGAFRFPALPAGRYRLTARKGPLAGALAALVSLAATGTADDLTIAVRPGLTIGGAVSATSGTPLAGARIQVRSLEGAPGIRAAVADQTGRYLVDGLLPGRYQLEVSSGNHPPERAEVELTRALTRDFVFGEAVQVEVLVLTSRGHPAGTAEIGFEDPAGRNPRAIANPDGRFVMPFDGGGELSVQAVHGNEEGRAGPLSLAAGQPSRKVTIRLAPGGRVSGVVRWEDGRPAAAAQIEGHVPGWAGPRAEATAGDDGRFTVGPLSGDTVVITARGPGERFSIADGPGSPNTTTVKVARGEHRIGLALVIPRRDAAITGLVVDGATGRPIAGAALVAGLERPGESRPAREGAAVVRALTGPDGAFTLERLLRRSYTVWTSHPGHGDSERAGVAAGTAGLRLALRRAGSLAGTVVASDGQPVPSYTLLVLPPPRPGESEAARALRATDLGAPAHRIDDERGAFAVGGLEPGSYDLIATTADGRVARAAGIALAEGQTRANLRLVAGGAANTVRGRVVDARSGRPVPDVRVQVELAGTPPATRSDADGRFQLDGVPALPRLRVRLTSQAHRATETRVVPPAQDGRADLGTVALLAADLADPYRTRTGGAFRERQGKLFVELVRPGSAAARAGFQPGDQVLSIAGQPASGDVKEAAALLNANPGVAVPVVLQAPGQAPRQVQLQRTVQ